MNKLYLSISTDIHGTLSAYSYIHGQAQSFGFSRYMSFLNQIPTHHEVIKIDNGDSLQGSPLLSYVHREQIRPNPMALALNQIHLDYVNVGNHDFNYGEDALLHYLKDLNAHALTTNVLYQDQAIGASNIHITQEGLRIGLIGLCTDYIPHWERPEHIQRFRFLDPLTTLESEVSKLRLEVDYVIVLYHGGLERDALTGEPTEPLTGENVGYALTQVKGVDAVISGHQHRSICTHINGVLFMQCSLNLQELMWLELDPNTKELQGQIINLVDYPIDDTFEQFLAPYQKQTAQWLDVVIGQLEMGSCFIDDPFQARLHKHPFVSLLNQIQLELTQADISATALFNQPIGLPQAVRMRDIVNNYVYPNTLVLKEMDGKTLRAYLEFNADYFTLEENQVVVNPSFSDPKPQHFNYDMLDGIEYVYDYTQARGSRLVSCLYQGKTVEDDQRFKVVMNNYRASGGGNFSMIPSCVTLQEFPLDMSDVIAAYIASHSPVQIKHQNNIRILPNG
jgi:2',3'-cyclic-nucleotide 2'-phosphodiesterase / 3'-nucleotidase